VGAADVQGVEQAEHRPRQIAEGVLAIHTFGGSAVTGHVDHNDAELPGKRFDIARVVGKPRGSRSATVKHQQGMADARFADENLPTTHLYRSRGQGRKRFFIVHCQFLA